MPEILIIQISKDELRQLIEDSISNLIKTKKEQHPKTHVTEALIKIDDVCEMLQISKVTIHKWKKKGLIPFHRISNRIFFKRSEVLASLTKDVDLRAGH